MPDNFTFNKVRELLDGLKDSGEDELRRAIAFAKRQQIRGPLAIVIFVKHHLTGAHEVEIDRVDESEEGARYAVLVYPEGELALPLEFLPADISNGMRLRYDPNAGQYS
jgi:hypothetical protein